jgi:hypothetical protein
MNIPDEILPNLWLGSFEDSQNKDFIMKNNINCIINCTLNKPFVNLKIEYKYRIPSMVSEHRSKRLKQILK